MADISIIIRTHNSEKHIWKCLKAVRDQTIPRGLEVETIVVDNESSDRTVEIARSLAGRVVGFAEARPTGIYTPGAALNVGIEDSTGGLILVLSSHCIPANTDLLTAFHTTFLGYGRALSHLEAPFDLAGMYGRQLPAEHLSLQEKIELYTVFGNENQLQSQHPFFHNGCSCLLKAAWEVCPFSEKLDTLEDRDWAYRIQQQYRGRIIYISSACVTRHVPLFHHEHVEQALHVIEATLRPMEILVTEGNC